MTSDKPLLRVLAGQARFPPPVWLMRQAGRYLPEYREVRARVPGFLDLCYTPELAVEVTLQPLRRFPLDAAILFSDILVVPHALGARVRFVEGEGPRLDPIRERAGIEGLSADRLHEHLAPVYETLRRLRGALPDRVALIGFAGAPWTLAAYMVEGGGSRDFQEARLLARRDPALFARLIALLEAAVGDYLAAQVEAGAEVLQLFDSWAGVLPEPELVRWCLLPAARIVARLRERCPGVPVILFPRGAGPLYVDFARETGAAALSLDTQIPVRWARENLDGPVLQGNLDPVALLAGAAEAEAERIARAFEGRPHVFNLGHGVPQGTDPEAVGRMLASLKSLRPSAMSQSST